MTQQQSDDLREAAAKAIKSLGPLTYQQNQLINTSELAPVFEQIVKQRLVLTVVIAVVALLFNYFGVHFVLSGSPNWFSITVVIVCIWLLYSRISKQKGVAKILRENILSRFRITALSPCMPVYLDTVNFVLLLNWNTKQIA